MFLLYVLPLFSCDNVGNIDGRRLNKEGGENQFSPLHIFPASSVQSLLISRSNNENGRPNFFSADWKDGSYLSKLFPSFSPLWNVSPLLTTFPGKSRFSRLSFCSIRKEKVSIGKRVVAPSSREFSLWSELFLPTTAATAASYLIHSFLLLFLLPLFPPLSSPLNCRHLQRLVAADILKSGGGAHLVNNSAAAENEKRMRRKGRPS